MLEKISVFKNVQWKNLISLCYIEPFVFILVFAHSLSGTVLRNEIIYQACTVVFGYNVTDCQQLGTNNLSDHAKEIETEVQPYAANLFMIRTLLESIVPAICGVFVGSWSDHYGRKPLLEISMIGFSFTYVIAAVICELSRHYVVNPWYYILAVLPHSLLGGNCVFSVAVFCYISDITDTKMRPYRMISVEAAFFIGLMVGSLISSFVYAATNATITFAISGVLLCVATVLIFFIPESLVHKKSGGEGEKATSVDIVGNVNEQCEEKICEVLTTLDNNTESDKETNGTNGTQMELKQNSEKSSGEAIKKSEVATVEKGQEQQQQQPVSEKVDTELKKTTGLFSYVHIRDMLITCFRERPYYDRSIIWLVTGTMFLSIFVIDGIMTVFYLFVREKFHWTIRDFTFYETVSHMVPMLGAILGFVVLRKVFKMSVVSLALLACISEMLSNFVKGVAAEPWHLYLSTALGAFKAIGGPMCRTIVSNIVPANDLGKIFSIKNILQSIAPFLAAPLYTFIYKQSLTTYPGLFNLVSAGLYLMATVFIIIVLRFKYSYKDHYANILK